MSMTTTLAKKLLGELARSLRIDDTDDRQDEQPVAHLEDRSRKLADRLLLLADRALALLHESDGHCDGDPVGGRLIRIEDPVQEREIALVFRKQGACEHVAQQKHDADDFVGFNASRNDPFGQVARVGLECLEGAAFERLHVFVVD